MKSFCQIYAQWDQTGARMEAEARHLLDLGLVCDTSLSFGQARRQQSILLEILAAGGLCAPNIYPADFDPSCRDSNWWKYSESQCVDLLRKSGAEFSSLDLGPMCAVNTYTPGNTFVAACRRAEVRYILGFCAPIVIEDGGWEIAHYGSPLTPYFVSDEDFRKPEAGDRTDAVLMASMEQRNPMVCLDHWSEGPWCPLNALAADRWLEPSADPLPFLQVAEDWLRQSEQTGRPLFFTINLQYFFSGRCYEHNRKALEWLADQRDKGRLEVGGLQAWRHRLEQAGGFQRQISYWRGEMMGSHVGHRPGCFPDVIVDECLEGQKIWKFPEPMPRRHYDYRKRWDFPAFQPDGTAPSSAAFDAVEVTIESRSLRELERAIDIRVQNCGPALRLPLALWDAFQGWCGPLHVGELPVGWAFEIVPHPAGSGGALLLEGEVQPGQSQITVSVAGGKASPHLYSKNWGGLVCAQTFFQDGRPYTYLVSQTPDAFVLGAKIHRREHDQEPIIAEYLVGIEYGRHPLEGNVAALRFDGARLTCWHRFWGVTADQIELTGVEEIEARLRRDSAALVASLSPGLEIAEPGYQLFGNIREASRWDRQFARMSGDVELHRMKDWFCRQRPEVGEVVIEAHPGLFLPRGSITKVLGHEFDFLQCSEGYGFKELCVDYPQSWTWGVSAWVQWRHLRVQLAGLKPGSGPYLLHLHAFDPEARDIAQRVHFFNPELKPGAPLFAAFPVHQNAEICAVSEWNLPRGVEGRWLPSALCSVLIPDACLDWPSIGVWISPLEKSKLYDWVAERGAPGVLSHLWVTRRNDFKSGK